VSFIQYYFFSFNNFIWYCYSRV